MFDATKNLITVERDCAGKVVDGEYTLFDIFLKRGGEDEVFDGYFAALGVRPLTLQKRIGYTSWYNYYQNISESVILRDLDGLEKLPVKPDVFQIDDGYETFVGDWMSIDKAKFPNGLNEIAKRITSTGYTAGIWLAPFVCETKSMLYATKKNWLLRDGNGNEVDCGGNWSGMRALDLGNPEVRAYVKECIGYYRAMGFTLFKLDFLYAACMIPHSGKTRGELMKDGMELLREACGDAQILGCGVPLASAFGTVEYCRIGPDMSLSWNDALFMRGFHAERPSTKHTMLNTIYRRQLSGRAFLSDPDVFLLRDYNNKLKPEQKRALAFVNALFGGVLFASDDFSTYDDNKNKLYEQIISALESDDKRVREENGVMKIEYAVRGQKHAFEYKING